MRSMPSYVAFLRAINLGAKRKFPKDDIRRCAESAGFTDVATHINTGNVRLTTSMRSRARIEQRLEQVFREDRGFEVPTIVYPCAEVARIAADVEELHDPALERHYVQLLKDELSPETLDELEALSAGAHRVVVRHRAAHVLLGEGYQAGRVDPMRVERLLGVTTNRSHTVIRAIAEKWC